MHILNFYIGGITVNFKKIIAGAVSMLFVSAFAVSGNLFQDNTFLNVPLVSAESYSTDGSAVILHSCYDNKTFDSWQSAYNDVLNNSEFINEFSLPQTELVKESVKFALINIDDSGRPLLALCNSSAYAYGGARLLSYDTETQKIVLVNDFMPFGGYGSIQYNNGYIYGGTGHQGVETISVYTFQNNAVQHEQDYYVEYGTIHQSQYFGLDETAGSYGEDQYLYYIGGYYDSSTNSYLMENVVSKDEFLQSINQYGIKKPSCLTDNIEDTGMQILDYNKDMYEITPNNISSVLGIENGNKCGDNATWSFDEATGTLTISGTGDMYDYFDNIHFSTDERSSPWLQTVKNISDIKSIVIEEGITSIGAKAFYDLAYVSSVSLPSTLTKIGAEAFRVFSTDNCASMFKTITIPASVTEIGEKALGYYDTSTSDGDVHYTDGLLYDLTINGYKGSVAEKYAQENNASFISLTENGDSNNENTSTDSKNDNSDDKSDGKTVIPSSPETGDNLLAGAGVASVIAGAGLYISAKKKNKK